MLQQKVETNKQTNKKRNRKTNIFKKSFQLQKVEATKECKHFISKFKYEKSDF